MRATNTDYQSKCTLKSKTIWADLNQLPDVLFFEGLLAGLDEHRIETTARRREQTVQLAQRVGFEPKVIGDDFDTIIARRMGIPYRTLQLLRGIPDCDIAFSARNAMSVLAARIHGIPSIHFTDNDITAHTGGLWAEQPTID